MLFLVYMVSPKHNIKYFTKSTTKAINYVRYLQP